ncbi:organic cation transporter protein-like [Saccoglossus kowalevskii]
MTVPVIYFILVFQFPPTIPWCKVPHIDKIKHQFCIDNVTSNCEEFVKNLTIPKHRKNVGCGSVLTYDQCHRYDISYETMSYVTRGSIQSYFNNTKTVECDIGWEYDESYSTVTSEFDLVCGRSYLNTLVLTVNMTGMLVVSEHVGPTKRAMVGLIYPIFFSIGYMLLAVYAYFIREWWKLQLATIAPSLVFLSYWWIIPESPRWLISKGRIEEAKKIIQLSARVNNITIPKNALDGLREQKKYETNDQTKHRAIDLLKFPNMRKKTLILFYFWCICGLVYFGISFGTSNLGGNPYLNVFIAAAVEIPAYGVSFVMMENGRIGRRWSAFCSMGFCGVSNIALSFVPACGHMVWIRTTLTMLGKFCITTSFAIIIIFSAEIFPTALS